MTATASVRASAPIGTAMVRRSSLQTGARSLDGWPRHSASVVGRARAPRYGSKRAVVGDQERRSCGSSRRAARAAGAPPRARRRAMGARWPRPRSRACRALCTTSSRSASSASRDLGDVLVGAGDGRRAGRRPAGGPGRAPGRAPSRPAGDPARRARTRSPREGARRPGRRARPRRGGSAPAARRAAERRRRRRSSGAPPSIVTRPVATS